MGGAPDDPDAPREPEGTGEDHDTQPLPRHRPDDGGAASGSDQTGPEEPTARGTARVGQPRPQGGGGAGLTEEELEGLHRDAAGVPLGARRVQPLEIEASRIVARYLFPTERYRGEWKRHWIHLSTPVIVGVLSTLALGYLAGLLSNIDAHPGLTTIPLLLWLAVMSWAGWRIGDWWFDRFILTNRRVMVVKGIVTRSVAMMPLQRVTDMKYDQSPLARMLNYGTFILESAGQEQALREVKHLPNPNELYLRVVEEMYEPQAVEARLGRAGSGGGEGDDDGS